MSEPINLREWQAREHSTQSGRLFTCGRPGRGTNGRRRKPVEETIINKWVAGLPNADPLHIVSLLGWKDDGWSEFNYYPFRSSEEEEGQKPTFAEWLKQRYGPRFVVDEFLTEDANGEIPHDVLEKATSHVLALLRAGCTTLVIDSAGSQRTARVCEAIGYPLG